MPDLLDPANTDKAPFVQGQFIVGRKARVKAFLANDANLSLDRIEILDGGSGYSSAPKLFIGLPSGTERGVDFEPLHRRLLTIVESLLPSHLQIKRVLMKFLKSLSKAVFIS